MSGLFQVTYTYGKERPPQWASYPTFAVSENISYWIELDQNDRVVGGEYKSWDRPDFAWKSKDLGNFYGYFNSLKVPAQNQLQAYCFQLRIFKDLYEASINGTVHYETRRTSRAHGKNMLIIIFSSSFFTYPAFFPNSCCYRFT